MELWRCSICGYTYDPEKGDAGGAYLLNTPFEALPSDWRCPNCKR